jgi:hypothetical protein
MKIPMLIAAAGLVATALPAQAAPPAPQRTCFRMHDVESHSIVDNQTIYVSARGRDVYRITTSNNCFAAKSRSDPLITRSSGGSDLICKPIDLDLRVGGSGGVSPCIVSGITKLNPAEVAAIPKKLRP